MLNVSIFSIQMHVYTVEYLYSCLYIFIQLINHCSKKKHVLGLTHFVAMTLVKKQKNDHFKLLFTRMKFKK